MLARFPCALDFRKLFKTETIQTLLKSSGKMALFLYANIHQGDELFSVHSRGKQCAFMSLSAVLTAQNILLIDWSTTTFNNVLSQGDKMYLWAVEPTEAKNMNVLPIVVEPIEAKSINQPVDVQYNDGKITNQMWFINYGKELQGLVITNLEIESHYYGIHTALLNTFLNGSYAILILEGYMIALIKQTNVFYLFDSHSRDFNGMPDPN